MTASVAVRDADARLYVGVLGRPDECLNAADNDIVTGMLNYQRDFSTDMAVLANLQRSGWVLAPDYDPAYEDTWRFLVSATKKFATVEDAIAEAVALGGTGRTLDWNVNGSEDNGYVVQ